MNDQNYPNPNQDEAELYEKLANAEQSPWAALQPSGIDYALQFAPVEDDLRCRMMNYQHVPGAMRAYMEIMRKAPFSSLWGGDLYSVMAGGMDHERLYGQLHPKSQVYGWDRNKAAIDRASQSKGLNIHAMYFDFDPKSPQAMPFHDGNPRKVPILFARAALSHVPYPHVFEAFTSVLGDEGIGLTGDLHNALPDHPKSIIHALNHPDFQQLETWLTQLVSAVGGDLNVTDNALIPWLKAKGWEYKVFEEPYPIDGITQAGLQALDYTTWGLRNTALALEKFLKIPASKVVEMCEKVRREVRGNSKYRGIVWMKGVAFLKKAA